MANFLSLLFQAKISPHSEPRFKTLFVPEQAEGNESTQILHYAWATLLPPQTAPPGNWVLLTTAYDLDFAKYIAILVQNNPGPFNYAVQHLIVGAESLYPVFDANDPTRLNNFIQWIAKNDLSQRDPTKGNGGVSQPVFQGYYWGVTDIIGCLGGPGDPPQ
ncbi:MAG TPA: hypothetical protein VGX96_01265 [Candidatus Elarobacter sp.]|jgi:hypothetical protein|nr:hypothetical protein [Candidatus Elarobacter sp.]